MDITVRYWIGATQYSARCRSYAGAMRLAGRNRNAFPASFWAGERKLLDDGVGLVYEDTTEGTRWEYAVMAAGSRQPKGTPTANEIGARGGKRRVIRKETPE